MPALSPEFIIASVSKKKLCNGHSRCVHKKSLYLQNF